MNALNQLKFDDNGLIPAIAQDHKTSEVLMVAWMNRESLALSMERNQAVYWSRSRNRLWAKGEESGHVQKIIEMRIDCDADVILLQVEQIGGIACHTGRKRCFYRVYRDGEWVTDEDVIKDPKDIYK